MIYFKKQYLSNYFVYVFTKQSAITCSQVASFRSNVHSYLTGTCVFYSNLTVRSWQLKEHLPSCPVFTHFLWKNSNTSLFLWHLSQTFFFFLASETSTPLYFLFMSNGSWAVPYTLHQHFHSYCASNCLFVYLSFFHTFRFSQNDVY